MTTRPRIVLAASVAATAICTLVVTSATVADAATGTTATNCSVPTSTASSSAATTTAATTSAAKPAATAASSSAAGSTSTATTVSLTSPAAASMLAGTSNHIMVGETSGSTFPTDIDSYASTVGTAPDVVMWYVNWANLNTPLIWPKQQAGIDARNVTPMITWSPDDSSFSITALANGSYDSYLVSQANLIKSWNRTVLIRPLHEMNGNWAVYGTTKVTAAQYVAAWRHLVTVFRSAGATNVKWVWSPNTYGFGGTVPFDSYYPGDAYVDWTGLDGYNSFRWNRSFATIYQQSYDDITALTSKPLMVAEWGDPGRNTDKAQWITNAFATVKNTMPRIKMMETFDRSKEEDWRVNSSADSLAAYQAALRTLNP